MSNYYNNNKGRNNYNNTSENRYRRGGNSNYDSNDELRKGLVKQVKEQTGGYFKSNEISLVLDQCNNDVNECITILNDKRSNSWSAQLFNTNTEFQQSYNPPLPNTAPIQNPPPVQNTNNSQNTTSYSNAVKNNKNKNGSNNQQAQTRTTTSDTTTTTTPTKKVDTQPTTRVNTPPVVSDVTSNVNQQRNPQTNFPTQQNEMKPADFDVVERTLVEKQMQLNREAESLNSLLTDIKGLKDKKNGVIGGLLKEKQQLEEKKIKAQEELNRINNQLRETDSQISNLEREFTTQFSNLQKKAELFQQRLAN